MADMQSLREDALMHKLTGSGHPGDALLCLRDVTSFLVQALAWYQMERLNALTADEAAAAAVGLVGSRRVVLSVPSWRSVLMRFTSVTPSVSMKAERVFLWEGRRRMRRR